jgi:hypothetical protein
MVVIADVVGKSVPAALLMATLQASLRTIAGEGAPLVDLVARLNRHACAHSHGGQRFTTAVLSEYDPQTRRLSYVNAGHNAPILRRSDGLLEKLEVGGMPLGINGTVSYETDSVDLRPGDALIFYTDGVVEAFNDQYEEFGNDRWSSVIRALPMMNAQESLQCRPPGWSGLPGYGIPGRRNIVGTLAEKSLAAEQLRQVLPDELGGHSSAFVRRDRGPALPGHDPCAGRGQFDQLAPALADAAGEVACGRRYGALGSAQRPQP